MLKNMPITQFQIVTTAADLQKAFFVRGIVFCEEQHVSYEEEVDGQDYVATHFLGTIDGEPVAAARMRVFKDCVKIERLAVRTAYRGQGIGKNLLTFVLRHAEEMGYAKIKLHAQAYLLKFYEKFGFVRHGEMFLDARIEHYAMEKSTLS
jgi:predicted GNAT family N-acyltransferase